MCVSEHAHRKMQSPVVVFTISTQDTRSDSRQPISSGPHYQQRTKNHLRHNMRMRVCMKYTCFNHWLFLFVCENYECPDQLEALFNHLLLCTCSIFPYLPVPLFQVAGFFFSWFFCVKPPKILISRWLYWRNHEINVIYVLLFNDNKWRSG